MPENKKHHFVPRFYLKLFSKNEKSINIFNIPLQRTIVDAGLKNQCYRDYMYGKDPSLEKGLSIIEGAVSGMLKKVISESSLDGLTPHDRESFLFYLMIQHARTAYSVDTHDEQTDRLMKYLLQGEVKKLNISQESLDAIKITQVDSARYVVSTAAAHYPLLIDLEWRLINSVDGQEFLTSDNPAVFYNQFLSSRRYMSNTGVATKGLQIFLPLSPSLLLMLYDADVYGVGDRREKDIFVKNSNDVAQINNLQFISASENVYFRSGKFPALQEFKKVERYRRKKKSEMKIFPGEETEDTKKEILMVSKEDLRTDLSISFVRILKPAKKWLMEFQDLKYQPGAIVRNEPLMKAHEEFMEMVKAKQYQAHEFFSKYIPDTKWR